MSARKTPLRPPWALAENDFLHACTRCGDRCEAGAIRFPLRAGGISAPALDSIRRTGCGACFAPCPTGAVSVA